MEFGRRRNAIAPVPVTDISHIIIDIGNQMIEEEEETERRSTHESHQ